MQHKGISYIMQVSLRTLDRLKALHKSDFISLIVRMICDIILKQKCCRVYFERFWNGHGIKITWNRRQWLLMQHKCSFFRPCKFGFHGIRKSSNCFIDAFSYDFMMLPTHTVTFSILGTVNLSSQ